MLESQHENIISNDILVVDDEVPNLQLLSELLGGEGYQVRPANNPKLAIDSAIKRPPKLILLDVKMPGIDGYEVCKRLKQDERTRDIPIIFVSALQDLEDRIKGFKAGGVDFVSKPFQEEEVLARVRTHMDLRNMQLNLTELVAESTAELVRSEAKYRNLVENALVGVFNSTLDGRLIFVNEAMVRMFDFDTPEQMMTQGAIERWIDQNNREQLMSYLQEHGSLSNAEAETITASGRHIHLLLSVRLQDEVITGMVMDISKRKQSEQRIIDYQQRLKAQATQLNLVEEQERRRIAMELHDNVGQTLALSRLQLAAASKAVEDDALKEQFDELSQTLLSAIKDTRQLIFDLSSPTLYELGLGAAISEWIELKLKPHHSLDVKLVDKMELSCLSQDQSTILFRSVRELLTNIIKYARADNARVLLEQEGSVVCITVKDNGIGFNPDQVKRNVSSDGGLGLFSIEERMNDFGGSMVIDSRAYLGTSIVLTVPGSETIKAETR